MILEVISKYLTEQGIVNDIRSFGDAKIAPHNGTVAMGYTVWIDNYADGGFKVIVIDTSIIVKGMWDIIASPIAGDNKNTIQVHRLGTSITLRLADPKLLDKIVEIIKGKRDDEIRTSLSIVESLCAN